MPAGRRVPFESPQIAPTGIEPGSDSKSPLGSTKHNIASSREGLVIRTPSIVPHDAERDTYLVLDDFAG
jgi:hypothetical protein